MARRDGIVSLRRGINSLPPSQAEAAHDLVRKLRNILIECRQEIASQDVVIGLQREEIERLERENLELKEIRLLT